MVANGLEDEISEMSRNQSLRACMTNGDNDDEEEAREIGDMNTLE